MRRLILFLLLILAGGLLLVPPLQAQGTSDQDTVRIVSVTGKDTVDVVIAVRNQTVRVAAWNFQFKIDTNRIKPVTIVDGSDYYVDYTLLAMSTWVFGQLGARNVQYFPDIATIRGIFYQDYDSSVVELSYGTWQMLKMRFVLNAGLANGMTTAIDLFNDYSAGGLIHYLYDATGLVGVEPTLVDGTVTVGTGPTPGTNDPPIIDPLTSPISVLQGGQVNFTVRAHDPDGDNVTLTATGLPTGATFTPNPAVGDSLVTGVFNWAVPTSATGSYTVNFRAVDDSSADAQRSVVINIETVAADLLYLVSSQKRGIQGGIPGTQGIAIPVDLQAIRDIYGLQFDVEFNQSICKIDSINPTDRLTGFTIYENIGNVPGKVRVITYGLDNEKILPGTTGSTIMNIYVSIKPTATAGLYPFEIKEAWESVNPNPNAPSVTLPFDSAGILAVDQLGDVNTDTRIDVADLVSLVGYIIGDWTLTDRQFRAANINGDAEANVVDLVAIMNSIFGIASPAPFASYSGPDADVRIDFGDLSGGQTGLISLNADLPTDVAGVQLKIAYDPNLLELAEPNLSDRSGGFNLKFRDNGDGQMVILMYFKSASISEVIKPGLGQILSVPIRAKEDIIADDNSSPVRLSKIVLSSPNGSEIPVKGFKPIPNHFTLSQNYPNPFNPTTTIDFEIMSSAGNPAGSQVDLVVYNLLGQKVKTLASGFFAPGQYSYKWDGTDETGDRQASGVYFYSLISADSRVTKKMVLAK